MVRAVAQHGGFVAEGHHLVEPVRDIEYRAARGADFAQHAEQAFGLVAGQGGGWLVHDVESGGGIGLARKALEMRTSIWSPRRQARHLLARVDMGDAEPFERVTRRRVEHAPVDQKAGAATDSGGP